MTYRFGVFTFDDRAGMLTRGDRAVPLEPQPARALTLLLSRAGDVVSREELRAHLWGDETHVDVDRGLAYCIGQLRAALGDSGDNPRFVQTLPRRGFSFIAPVDTGTANDQRPMANAANRSVRAALLLGTAAVFLIVAGGGWWAASRGRSPERPIVAVAMFENLTGDASRDPVIAALADVIVERLTTLSPARIGVNGNSSVLQRPRADRDPRAVARDTHASFLVSGSLTRKDGRLSLLIQLIRLDDGTHVWVQRVSRPPNDRLETLDDDVAAQIETAVRRIMLKDGLRAS
jgi:DNA-binding winged helix-turn-helix (wHTH) protein/TolB-like protein